MVCESPIGRVRSLNIEEIDPIVWNHIIEVVSQSSTFKEGFKKEVMEEQTSFGKSMNERKKIRRRIGRVDKTIDDINDSINSIIVDGVVDKNSKELKPLKFGVYFEVLTPEQKEEYKTNYGLRVRAVVNKSPFFNAGVLPGDIILEIDDRKLFTLEDFYDDDNSSSIIFRRGEETLAKEIISS